MMKDSEYFRAMADMLDSIIKMSDDPSGMREDLNRARSETELALMQEGGPEVNDWHRGACWAARWISSVAGVLLQGEDEEGGKGSLRNSLPIALGSFGEVFLSVAKEVEDAHG